MKYLVFLILMLNASALFAKQNGPVITMKRLDNQPLMEERGLNIKANVDECQVREHDLREVYCAALKDGLLKPQLEAVVNKYLPGKDVFWGNYEGNHEWYGNSAIEAESIEELLNSITSSYGTPPKGIEWYIHTNVVEFVYRKPKR